MDPDPQKMNADPQPCPDRSPVLRIRIFFSPLDPHPEFDLIHLFSFKARKDIPVLFFIDENAEPTCLQLCPVPAVPNGQDLNKKEYFRTIAHFFDINYVEF